jgi:hypothetical protein
MLELDMALPPDKPAPPDRPAPPDKPAAAGRITHDSRGNAVWNWISESGKIAIDSTSRLLKRLDTSDLKLEESGSPPEPEPTAAPGQQSAAPGRPSAAAPGRSAPAAQGGYDPYSSRTPARNKPVAAAARPAQKPLPASKPPVPKPSFLARILGRK